jgi:integrase
MPWNRRSKTGRAVFGIAAIRFLLLSGCRRNEALTLQWKWIDFDHSIDKLPDSKTGQKVLLIGSGAIDLLKALDKVEGSPWVFPSAAGGTTPISIQKVWNHVRSVAGLEDLRLHDLRHNFASAAVSSSQSLYIVGKLLGHSQSQTAQRYAHLAPDPVRQAADDVSAKLGRKIRG